MSLPGRVEMDLSVEVGAHVVGMRDDLAVGAVWREALEVLDLQRDVGRPGRRADAEGNGQIDDFHAIPPYSE